MADQTFIEWADSTFNPWIGCTKISPACDNCYAAVSMPARTCNIAWGAGQPRRRTSPANWKLPLRWNREDGIKLASWENFKATQPGLTDAALEAKGFIKPRRRRVFCASLADVFDNEVDPQWRADLFALIQATPNLDWLLLTKRIGNAADMIDEAHGWADASLGWRQPLPNVWLGATITSQDEADRDLPKLVKVPAAAHFLSMEPLLGPVDIEKWLDPWTCSNCCHHGSEAETGPTCCADCDIVAVYAPEIGSGRCPGCGKDDGTSDDVGGTCPKCGSVRGWSRDYGFKFDSEKRLIDWVIAGGESGPGARPLHPAWVRSLRDQCAAASVPFLFKQWGEWAPALTGMWFHPMLDMPQFSARAAGRDTHDFDGSHGAVRIGKKAAGRLLDGTQHNEFPETTA